MSKKKRLPDNQTPFKLKDSDLLPRDLMGEIEWPLDVLVKAREAVIRQGYAPGGEDYVRSGAADNWAAIHVACHAICDNPKYLPKQVADEIIVALTVDEELAEMEAELRFALDEESKGIFETLSKFVIRKQKI